MVKGPYNTPLSCHHRSFDHLRRTRLFFFCVSFVGSTRSGLERSAPDTDEPQTEDWRCQSRQEAGGECRPRHRGQLAGAGGDDRPDTDRVRWVRAAAGGVTPGECAKAYRSAVRPVGEGHAAGTAGSPDLPPVRW